MKRIDSIIATTDVEPRPYQRNIVGKVFDMYFGRYKNGAGYTEPAAKSIMIESPTGSGKTVMGHLAARIIQEQNPDLVVGWVAMRRNLLTQAAAENKALNIGVERIHYVSMFDKSPLELVEARRSGRKILLVVDEAQHDAASSMAHLHNLIEPDLILGMTATPFRTDKVKLCFDKVVKDAGIHQLIQDGFLSKFYHYSIPEWTSEQVVEFFCREPETWGKSIFYFLNLRQCFEVFEMLREREDEVLARLREKRPDLPLSRGLVEIVTGGQAALTERILAQFRAGEVACLVNCMVLTEGFDDPTLETAFVRDSGKGPTMQMAGRAFRIHPEYRKNKNEKFKFKRIVQSKHTRWPILKTAMAAQQFLWQDEWRSLTVNPHLKEINNRARMAIARGGAGLPKWLADKNKTGRRRRGGGPFRVLDHD